MGDRALSTTSMATLPFLSCGASVNEVHQHLDDAGAIVLPDAIATADLAVHETTRCADQPPQVEKYLRARLRADAAPDAC